MSHGDVRWPDDAIAAALTLLLAGDHSPEVTEVASLSPGTTTRDAFDSVRALLLAQRIPILEPDATDADRLRLAGQALVHGGVSPDAFQSSWWHSLPPYDQQFEAQTDVSVAIDAWEGEADIASRGPLAAELRNAVARWLASAPS